ncbi:hypothetical protein [Spirillospora sp. NPDC029432]|uniref:hypothetical protein n=1 Tax=Spirillospora sp. NPDC029432 TaxID=3154599 RepID=UPI003456AD73
MAGNLFLAVDYGMPNAQDDGTQRPFTASPWWDNASIFLDPPRPTNGQAKEGQPSTVKVRVSNRADGAVDGVKVQAWVMNPHVGWTEPKHAQAMFTSGIKSVAPGSGSGGTLDPHVFTCLRNNQAWTPTAGQLTGSGGHMCLVANCFQDPLEVEEPEGAEIPPTGKFDVTNDPHQGQRNIMVEMKAKSLLHVPLMVPFDLMALPEVDGDVFLEIGAVADKNFLDGGVLSALVSSPEIDDVTGGEVPELIVVGSDGLYPVRMSQEPLSTRLSIPGLGEFRGSSESGGFEPIELPPDLGRGGSDDDPLHGRTPATLKIDISRDEAVGGVHAFEIVQRTRYGTQVGSGLRVAFVVTE